MAVLNTVPIMQQANVCLYGQARRTIIIFQLTAETILYNCHQGKRLYPILGDTYDLEAC